MSKSTSTNQWSIDPRKALRASEGFTLASLDLSSTPGWKGDKNQAKAHMARTGELMDELQERLYAEGRSGGNRSVLVVVQGLDTAGKGGIARHVMGLVDPQGVQLHAFGKPTKEELSHHFLWRIRKALPQPGRIGLFDRSHYEDVLAVRVQELVPREEWEKRYEEINKFEAELVESGTIILKFAMMISHDEQGMRLMRRLDRPDKYWKYSPGDLETRAQWNAYQEAYQAVFDLTSTDVAPWYVLPANRRWYPRLAVTEILTRTLIEMDMGWPTPEWDVTEQREKLSRSMSIEALQASLDATESEVIKGIEESIEVRRDSAAVMAQSKGHKDKVMKKNIAAAKDAALADMRQTIAHKKALIDARQQGCISPDVEKG